MRALDMLDGMVGKNYKEQLIGMRLRDDNRNVEVFQLILIGCDLL